MLPTNGKADRTGEFRLAKAPPIAARRLNRSLPVRLLCALPRGLPVNRRTAIGSPVGSDRLSIEWVSAEKLRPVREETSAQWPLGRGGRGGVPAEEQLGL